MIKITSALLFVIILATCGQKPEPFTQAQADIDYDILQKEENISFVNQARPVLEQRCIVCHGCYDAPCQLKLSSIEGIKRGSNPEKVYNAERLFAIEPTRMFIDANTQEEWRDKGFHSVLNEKEDNPVNNLRHSVLYNMLRLKQLKPQPRVGMIDDSFDFSLDREQTCPGNDKFNKYAKDFPLQGMPFGMPNLSDEEYHVLVKWISQGLPDDSQLTLPESTKRQIKKWEAFLNQSDKKHKLFSRYLYEHIFLGHVHFKAANNREFFRLVRSSTPPGKAIKEIATVRAFDDPGVQPFYYRLRVITSSIVDKTHFIYELSDKRMARYRELFFKDNYRVDELPSYEPEVAANPVKAFAALPVKSRYLFLLDDAKYFIEQFIKSPSCRGQVALNVIEDNFWIFFASPDTSVVSYDDHYLDAMSEDLNLPAEKGNTLNLLSAWSNYWDPQLDYMLKRQQRFKTVQKRDLDQALESIWNGESSMDKNNRALTIFRHFDSATVKHGLIGDYPETAWVIDYPLLERIHYLLVAGYDVYGNVGHQLTSRLYMDFLRMEGENTFLAYLPISHRKKIRDSWYEGIRGNKRKVFEQPEEWMRMQVVFGFKTDDPQREFYQKLEERMLDSAEKMDVINRCDSNSCKKATQLSNVDKQMQRIAKFKGKNLLALPELSFLRVSGNKKDQVYTLIHNKAYKNISFMLGDVTDRDYSLDTLSIYKGILGAYPNFFFTVHEHDIKKFADKLLAIENRDDYERFVAAYGVRRTASNFWENADWFNNQYAKQDPVDHGIFDLYRYNNQ